MRSYTHDVLEKIANYLKGKTSLRPTIGIICGSGISESSNYYSRLHENVLKLLWSCAWECPQTTLVVCLGMSSNYSGHMPGNVLKLLWSCAWECPQTTLVICLIKSSNYSSLVLGKVPNQSVAPGYTRGPLADTLDQKQNFPYHSIPDFPLSTVPGHVGQLVFGLLEGVPVLCMQGRFHYYEGYPIWKCAMPVRVMKLVGITHMIVTNAAGGLGDGYKVGDVMIIKDHVNFLGLAGVNPLRGPNDDKFGIRFPAMNKAYDEDLRNDAKRIAKELDIDTHVHEGVYACVGGPSYETIAELRMMKMMGINAIGKSLLV
uniref:Purine nucleoside phosphorylase n=1 Tax=Timema genevievae TaxID=629358 RepID=A0A7R9K5Q9_TIMGE|nr:unnamed protein product [Timema genevievae]